MSATYEEIIKGETLLRSAPGARHEKICERLHACFALALEGNATTRLLTPRSVVQISPGIVLRPDLALVTTATGKLWLAAEIVNSQDHRMDTVVKKTLYDDFKLPRLWMVDPRYDNVELYHGTPYGLALKAILAGSEAVTEALLPQFTLRVAQLFEG
jgi:Uma2 family endonuclease